MRDIFRALVYSISGEMPTDMRLDMMSHLASRQNPRKMGYDISVVAWKIENAVKQRFSGVPRALLFIAKNVRKRARARRDHKDRGTPRFSRREESLRHPQSMNQLKAALTRRED